MSCQKGNTCRTRPQKYNNQFAFKNDMHDKTPKAKMLNDIEIAGVCKRCKEKLEWKIKYRKYKIQNFPSKCTKCLEKTVRQSYHIICEPCAKVHECCPNCGAKEPLIPSTKMSKEEKQKFEQEMEKLLKQLPERGRRTFFRRMEGKDQKQIEKESKEIIENLKRSINDYKEFAARRREMFPDIDDLDDLDEF